MREKVTELRLWKQYAEKRGMSLSNLIRFAVREYVAKDGSLERIEAQG